MRKPDLIADIPPTASAQTSHVPAAAMPAGTGARDGHPAAAALDMRGYLRRLAAEGPIYFKANPGNAGDSMIAHATFEMFKELEITIQVVPNSGFNSEGKVVIYGGGGNLVEGRNEGHRFIHAHHSQARRFAILPHTVCGHEDLLRDLGENVDLITREEASLCHSLKHATRANVMIADDMALSINPDKLDSPMPSAMHPTLKHSLRRACFSLTEPCHRFLARKRSIDCFRNDRERTDIRRGFWNADIGKIFQYGTATPEEALCATSMVFNLLRRYELVRTNRLHVAIAGALLGMNVEFHPNSYFKCREVFLYSLMGRYPYVTWKDAR